MENFYDKNLTKYIRESLPTTGFSLDKDGKCIFCEDTLCKLTGYTKEELERINLFDEEFFRYIKELGFFSGNCTLKHKSGKDIEVWVYIHKISIGGQEFFVGLIQSPDSFNEIANLIIFKTPIGIGIFSESGFEFTNEYFCNLTGYEPDELRKIKLSDIVSEDGEGFIKDIEIKVSSGSLKGTIFYPLTIKRKEGNIKYVFSSISPTKFKGRECGLITIIDKTQNRELEDRVYKLENFDLLTSLPNKQLFTQELAFLIREAEAEESEIAVLLIDIWKFTDINDTLGHSVGDKIIKEVANRLLKVLNGSSIVARYGSDEFIVAIKMQDLTEVFYSSILPKLKEALSEPVIIDEEEIHIDINIGVSFYPFDGTSVNQLISNAELALKEAKKKGAREIFIFNRQINEDFKKQIILINELKSAIKNEEFDVYFQPKIDLKTGKVVGAEALARWKMPPNVFIPALVEANLMYDAGCLITRKTLCYASEILKGNPDLKISINMSFEQLRFDDCPDKFHGLTCQNEINPDNIIVEITETETMKNPDVHLPRLNRLKSMGYTISIDDFGTGYSSLNYLKLIPASEIKIDRSFIKDMLEDESDAQLVEIIIQIAKTMGMKVVAEGVETKEQAKLLRELGCDYAQGFYFAKPMPFKEFISYLKQQ